MSVTIGGVPGDAVLKLGDGTILTADGNGDYTLSGDQLSGVTLTPVTDYSGAIDLTMTTTVTDGDSTLTTESEPFTVTVTGVADAPKLDLNASVDGDHLMSL